MILVSRLLTVKPIHQSDYTALPLQLIQIDFFNFQQATGFAGDGSAGNQPSLDQLKAWLASGQSDPNIVRNPADPYEITRVNTGATNASTVTVKAYDIQADYSLNLGDMDWIIGVRCGLTCVLPTLTARVSRASYSSCRRVGRQNFATGAAPTAPDWKANFWWLD